MNIFKACALLVGLLFISVGHASAQDLIARQAPIDRKLKSIDSLALKRQLAVEAERNFSLADELYQSSWDTEKAHVYGTAEVPTEYRIDLRGFAMPTTNRIITSRFGPRWGRQHSGIDINVNVGDTIYAAFDGKIRVVQNDPRGYGKYIVIRHANGLETLYAHLHAWLTEVNQDVTAGQPIGLGGNTGRSTGAHLHFETRLLGRAIDPALMFDFKNQDVTGDFYNYSHMATVAATSTPAAKSTAATYYKVRRGDTLSAIAKRHGVSVTRLRSINGLTARSTLMVGRVLRVR